MTECRIITEEQQVSIHIEGKYLVLTISEKDFEDTRLYLTKKEAEDLIEFMEIFKNKLLI